MLYKARELGGYKLGALDGEIGKVKEFYFDDRFWTVRYLVADTGNWLTGRQVLISPHAVSGVHSDSQTIRVNLNKQKIEDSPSLEADKPVSRQFEERYFGYYRWPVYWYGPYAWGHYHYPTHEVQSEYEEFADKKWDPNLRSSREVIGYDIQAEDGGLGHIDDFVINDDTWTIRYLVVDTRNWWPGKEVLVSPRWIEQISWNEKRVYVKMNRDAIKQAPEYDKDGPITREYEDRLHRHYGQEGYWVEERLQKASK